jgi:hypothetical protein
MELDNRFEDDLQDALLDDVERQLVGQYDPIIFRFVEIVHKNLRAYADRHGYDVESTIASLGQPEVTRSGNRITVRIGWESEQMSRWEFGTSDHHIDGDPVLSFIWEENEKRAHDPPQWVRDEFEQEGDGWRVFLPEVDVRGIPEARVVRDGMHALRRVRLGARPRRDGGRLRLHTRERRSRHARASRSRRVDAP